MTNQFTRRLSNLIVDRILILTFKVSVWAELIPTTSFGFELSFSFNLSETFLKKEGVAGIVSFAALDLVVRAAGAVFGGGGGAILPCDGVAIVMLM